MAAFVITREWNFRGEKNKETVISGWNARTAKTALVQVLEEKNLSVKTSDKFGIRTATCEHNGQKFTATEMSNLFF